MIAKNYRSFAAAAAVQMVLKLGRPVWALDRPSTRVLRAIRASRAKLIASREQLVTWNQSVTPQWVKDAMSKSKELAKKWAAAQLELPFLAEKQEKAKTKEVLSRDIKTLLRTYNDNTRKDKHNGLQPAFLVLGDGWQLHYDQEMTRMCIGGYRQMHGYIVNRCPNTQGYSAN